MPRLKIPPLAAVKNLCFIKCQHHFSFKRSVKDSLRRNYTQIVTIIVTGLLEQHTHTHTHTHTHSHKHFTVIGTTHKLFLPLKKAHNSPHYITLCQTGNFNTHTHTRTHARTHTHTHTHIGKFSH